MSDISYSFRVSKDESSFDLNVWIPPSKVFTAYQHRKKDQLVSAYLGVSYRDRTNFKLIDTMLTTLRMSKVLPGVAHQGRYVQVIYGTHVIPDLLHALLLRDEKTAAFITTLEAQFVMRTLTIISSAEINTKHKSRLVFERCIANQGTLELRVLGPSSGIGKITAIGMADRLIIGGT